MKNFILLFSRAGRHKTTTEKLNRRIERRIARGMRYNHRKAKNVRPLRIKPVNYSIR